MKVVTPEQMGTIDKLSINDIGIPGIVLMENAAIRTVDEVVRIIGQVRGKNVCVFAGKGNNGGDAFAAARHLYNKGAGTNVYVLWEKHQVTGDAAVNLNALEKSGVSVVELTGNAHLEAVRDIINKADIIIDGIFGTGLKGEAKGLVREVIGLINSSGKTVVSIDIPSGVCGLSGRVLGACVKADLTVTFGLPKTGLVVHPGCEFAGELVVADIGIPQKVINTMDIRVNISEADYVRTLLPLRYTDSNKGDYGRAFIISGSTGMTGAGCLTASAALRTGAGLIYLGVPAVLTQIYDSLLMESVTIPLEDSGMGYLSKSCLGRILSHMERMTVITAGPGLSVNDDIWEIVSTIIEKAQVPLVLDADALNALSRDISVLGKLKTQAVITPHPGEMSRLMGITTREVQNNRIEAAREFACKRGVITVLKGARTVVAAPDGSIYINPTGNSGMATGGTGDVLTGVITGLIAQGAKPMDAAVAGVYLHGLAGDSVSRNKGQYGLIASDLVQELPSAIRMLMTGKEVCS